MTTASAIASHFVIRKSGTTDKVERLARLGRIGFPLVLLASNLPLVIIFFVV